MLPAIAIFVATDAKDFLVMSGGLDVVDGHESQLVGRIIQVLYTAVLSLFPAMLYFQFDRHRVGTIRSEWVRAIFRMDQRMETLADVNARYGDELAEASSYSTDSRAAARRAQLADHRRHAADQPRLDPARRSRPAVVRLRPAGRRRPSEPYFEFLVPTPSAAAMAFLGAYFFGTYLILRGYFRATCDRRSTTRSRPA